MFLAQLILFLFFASLSKTVFLQSITTTTPLTTAALDSDTNVFIGKIVNSDSLIIEREQEKVSEISSEDAANVDTTADEVKNEIFVNTLLEIGENSTVIDIPDDQARPHYEIDWVFIDKDTIRVSFELFSLPKTLISNNLYSEPTEGKSNIFATMTTMPSRLLKSISSLEYFLYTIRPYNQHREIILKMEKLTLKTTPLKPYPHYSNALRLSSLNHYEKYSICICYYKTNTSNISPDFVICQDVINDYAKFSHLRADAKHGLVFITTQYSIIIGLLVVLQSVFTMRKRRITQYIAQHVATTAHNIRTTLSSVSLVRQSFSSLDAAHEQQHHHTNNSHCSPREPTINEEDSEKPKTSHQSPTIIINQVSTSMNDGAHSSDETEPFLQRISSKNHVHFLLGPGEGSDDDHEFEEADTHRTVDPTSSPKHAEPYDDQADALLSMAHILDTNKPWSRYTDHTSPV